MGTENKKRTKVCESDNYEDEQLGDQNQSVKKRKKTNHIENSIQLVNSYDGNQAESTENVSSASLSEHLKLKKKKKDHIAINLDGNLVMPTSESLSNINTYNNASDLERSYNIENAHAHEGLDNLNQPRKKIKKKKHKDIQVENSFDVRLMETAYELSIGGESEHSFLKKKRHKHTPINPDDENFVKSDQPYQNHDKLSKMNKDIISEKNVEEEIDPESEGIPCKKKKKRKDLDKSNYFSSNLKNEIYVPENEKPIRSQSVSSNKNFGSLLNPTYLQNKIVENSDKLFNSFNDAKLLKKEEQKSRYPEIQDDTIELLEGRHYTLSIAVPASILEETCLLHELRTYVIGQLARAACIYSVDEIIVYNDQCWSSSKIQKPIEGYIEMMKLILEYQECPQYLRRDLIPRHPCMSKVGVLNALNAPHHLLSNQWCTYREGVVLHKKHGKVSFVDVGLRSDVQIDRKLEPGLRVTVKFPPEVKGMKSFYGSVVSPSEPRTKGGLYWGYTVRTANSLPEIFKSDDFQNGYDLIIGTSDKGDNIFDTELETFKHALVVFGGVDGLEFALEADAAIKEKDPRNLFKYYLNCCPNQQSRTIRTEEAVLITLSTLSEKLRRCGSTKPS